ncbi:Vesicle-mediated ER to Golgi transport protein [Tilletia horrida]|nr:Vesicle-mediated ER to Golgi transport protein [Tilletia horrida]
MLHGVDWLQRTARQLAQPQGGQQTAATALDTLASRLTSPESDLQTRKAAVLSIKGLARDHPSLTASKTLPALCTVLEEQCAKAVPPPASASRLGPEAQTWRELDEIARAALEAIIILCDPANDSQKAPAQGTGKAASLLGVGAGAGAGAPVPASLQHADIFLTKSESLHALLPLLASQHSFYTRFATLQLLSLLLRARPAAVQAHTLSAPGGYAAILDCLAPQDPNAASAGGAAPGAGAGGGAEIVRNEALLLLPLLVHANPDVQKLVAFEGAFERLLDVIALEGRIEGGLIVQDALEGIESLLTNNVSNQNYFRETLSIPMLAPLLFYPPPLPPQARGDRIAEADRQRQLDAFCFQQWDEQKILNARLVVGIGALLVGGQGEGRRLNQNAMATSSFTSALVHLALSSTAPPSLQAEALHTLSSIFRANRTNQELISNFEAISPVVLAPASVPGQGPSWDRQAPRSVMLSLLSLALYGPSSPNNTVEHPRSEAPYFAVLPGSAPAAAAETAPAPPAPGAQPEAPALAEPVVKGPFFHLKLRTAALAALEALVADNVAVRLEIVQSMVKSPEGPSVVTPGSLLLDALVNLPESTSTTIPPSPGEKSEQPKPIDPYVTSIACIITGHLVRGSTTVKTLARNVVFNVDGKAEWRDPNVVASVAAAAASGETGLNATASKTNSGADEDEEDDERPSLIQSLIGTLTSALRLQSDTSRLDRASITLGGLAVGHNSPTASWARVCAGLFTLLSVWCWDSPDDVRELLSESTNVQILVQAAVGGAAGGSGGGGASAPSLPTLSEPMLQSLAAYLLGIAYEFDTDPGQIAVDRATLFGILKARIGEDEFGTRVRRLKEDRRFASVGPDVLSLVGSGGSLGRSGAPNGSLAQLEAQADAFVLALASGASTADVPFVPAASATGGLGDDEWDGLWFDWPFVEAWKNNYVLIQKSILVDPASSSATKASSSAELQDALRQIEMLRDQVAKSQKEAEASQKALQEERNERREEHAANVRLMQESEAAVQASNERVAQLQAEHATALRDSEAQLSALQASLSSASTSARSNSTQLTTIQAELATTKADLDRVESERRQLEMAHQAQIARLAEVEGAHDKVGAERTQLQEEVKRLETELKEAKDAAAKAKSEAEAAAAAAAAATPPPPAPAAPTNSAELEELKAKVEAAEKRTTELEKENEDLLVLLEELTSKRKADKAKLQAKGEEVSDEEEEEEDVD